MEDEFLGYLMDHIYTIYKNYVSRNDPVYLKDAVREYTNQFG